MKHFLSLLTILLLANFINGQSNIKTLKSISTSIFKGDYNPDDYVATTIVDLPREIALGVNSNVNTDSLRSYLIELQKFENRNTGSDTISDTRGIGAARRWIYKKFEEFNNQSGNRLVVDYLQFDQVVCQVSQHKNVFAILPGRVPDAGMIIVEAHMDSRCEDVCDPDCMAEGMEDNGSGTALVIELARVLSQYTFDRTIIFLATTGEEQGLVGANAMARYMRQQEADIKAVLNNDVIGGIYCGETSSPPSCPGLDNVDSTQVRVFSFGGTNSSHKALARYCQMQYNEELRDIVDVPMTITVMSAEDRLGRGGDHIPFREQGYPSIRFTSANEHGDAGIDDEYHDRQHSVRDILGVDTDGDNIIDSLFVDLNYLARNTVINGLTAAMVSASPMPPTVEAEQLGFTINVDIEDPNDYLKYKVGVRTYNSTFDTLYLVEGTKQFSFQLADQEDFLFVSATAVDENELESCFSNEVRILLSSSVDVNQEDRGIILLQNRPNPFDEATIISWEVSRSVDYKNAQLVITDMKGQELQQTPIELNVGINEYVFTYGYMYEGIYNYSIVVDGQLIDTKTMVFAY